GGSTDFHRRTSAVRTARVTFPLTPALSLGERENPALAFSTTQRGRCPTNLPSDRTCRRLFPLPVGEGQDEGNRIAVRESDSDHARNWRISRASWQSRRFPKTMRILVVEDEPRLLRNLAKVLREEGYAVDTAEAGDDGLYKAENYNYDAIVLDVM